MLTLKTEIFDTFDFFDMKIKIWMKKTKFLTLKSKFEWKTNFLTLKSEFRSYKTEFLT